MSVTPPIVATLLLLVSTPALAAEPDADRARTVGQTGAAMSGVGAVLLGTAATIALTSRSGPECIDACNNMGLTLAAGGLGTVLLVPGALLTLAGSTRMQALDHAAGRPGNAVPAAVGWGLAGLGVASFGAGAWIAANPRAEGSPDPFIYAGLGCFAGAAAAGVMQLNLRDDEEVAVSFAPNGVVVNGTF